ncbi:acetyl esterase [Tanticharoenia sakaeratensis NBRC 103193]|uniref:Acetyl esterase n=2 Tax=Tanticharoenia TaxID=444052 RepID=A0A0D6MM97_9PROT|nr:acetyl esterase [Tanticharoenia sakaeratensis NBRC 103193]GBQ25405.1 esterase/lipase [Tanticharoenia sakaeratensis NBRC 103193]
MTRASLDPGVRAFLDRMAEATRGLAAFETLTPSAARAQAEAVRRCLHTAPPRDMARIEEIVLEDIAPALRLRIYTPPGDARGVLAYFHGGGWTMFSLDTHDRLMRAYATGAGMVVVGFDYVLTPEYVFPTALHQVIDGILALRDAERFPALARLPLFAGGDSAGANLVVAAALSLRDAGKNILTGLMLTYGVFDSETDRPSYSLYDGPDYMLTANEMELFWSRYIHDPGMRSSPLASPLHASLAGLPRVSMTIAECDVLRDENLTFAQKLRNANVNVDAKVYPGTTHSFIEAFEMAAVAKNAVDDQCKWLKTWGP